MDLLILYDTFEKVIQLLSNDIAQYNKTHIEFINNPLQFNLDFLENNIKKFKNTGRKVILKGGGDPTAAAAAAGAPGATSSANPSGDGKKGVGKEGDGKEGDGKEGDGKEGDGKEGDGKEGDGKEGDGKEGDANTANNTSNSSDADNVDPAEAAAKSEAERRAEQNDNSIGKLFKYLVKVLIYPFIFLGLLLVPWFYVSIKSFKKIKQLFQNNLTKY